MRIPAALHVVAGIAIVLLVGNVLAEPKNAEEKKNELTKPLTNSIQKPSILSMIRRLLPDQKTIDSIRAAVNSKPTHSAKSLTSQAEKTRSLKSKKTPAAKETKIKASPQPAPKKVVKPTQGSSRLRTSVSKSTPAAGKLAKKVAQTKTNVGTKQVQQSGIKKQKNGKQLRSRQNSKTSFSSFNEEKSPTSQDLEILTPMQKQNRLRQELVRETEDNCLAKILCGTSSKPKPKQQQNTLVSDTAYLIKEFFNIFDFTIDTVRDEINEIDEVNKKAYEAEEAEKKKKEEKQDDEDGGDSDEDDDDEEDDVFRKSPVNEQPKKKYTTRTPTTTKDVLKTPSSSPQPATLPTESSSKAVAQQVKTPRPKPVSNLELTTSGDMVPHRRPSASSNMDRLGEYVTPSSNLFTSTFMSTSMIGSATLKPVDMPFSIPLKTGKDDQDDEDDYNQKYHDQEHEEESSIHRVTLEELVGDIQLSPSEFDMIRRGRSMRQPRMKIALKNLTNDKYIQTKLKQMKLVQNEAKKLKIAEKVARSMREPRQCRQFTQVAQEVLQTCPLTTEVIKFFNTNLKNGTSIEVKKTPPGSQTKGGGLVILNNDDPGTSQQAYFVDNSPKITPSKIQTDLKNPSVPNSFNEDEDQYTVYEKRPNPNPQNGNLNQYGQDVRKKQFPTTTTSTTESPKKETSKEESDEEQDDEGDSEESEEEDLGRRDSQEYEDDDEAEDDTGSNEEEEDDESNEEDDSDDDSQKKVKTKVRITIQNSNDHQKIQGAQTNQPNVKIAVRPQPAKKPTGPAPTLPPGVISVYGVPTSSFDREFSQLNGQIGKPINLFGDEFIDTPPYKRRRPAGKYVHRTSKRAKSDGEEDDELENVAFNARVPKHPPLAVDTFVHDGDEDDDTKRPYQNPPKKNQSTNSGKPLGGIKGGNDDDDKKDKDRSAEKRDSSEDKDDKSSEKKNGDDKDNSAEEPPEKITSIDESPFSPSIMYGFDTPQAQASQHFYGNIGGGSPLQYGSQIAQYHHQQHHHHESVPMRRPHAYRPLVRPIKIMPDVNVPITGVNFRPSRDYMRPGRLYPMYHGK